MQTTSYELGQVNEERKKKGLPPLTSDQARRAVEARRRSLAGHAQTNETGFDMSAFLVGYVVASAMLNAAAQAAPSIVPSTPSPAYDPPTSYDPPSYSGGSEGSGGSDGSGGGGFSGGE
jgi:hypothetical protein